MAGTIPTTLESLSTTAASNDPTEGSGAAMTLVNDGLRAAYAFVRQTVTAGSDIASASTITPPSTGSSFNLTGTTTVTAIGSTNSWDGRIVWFRHAGAHSFTNSATLVCLGGSSITFASGDISAWRQRIPGTWDQVVYSKAGALPLFNTGGHWSIDSSGRLLNGGNTQPSIVATDSASKTTAGSVFDTFTEVHDQAGDFNPTTGVFTCPVAGDYMVFGTFSLSTSSGQGTCTVQVRKNGVSQRGFPYSSAAVTTPGVVRPSFIWNVYNASAGDTIDTYLAGISGSGASAIIETLTIRLLG